MTSIFPAFRRERNQHGLPAAGRPAKRVLAAFVCPPGVDEILRDLSRPGLGVEIPGIHVLR
jgi:hypothetical protein